MKEHFIKGGSQKKLMRSGAKKQNEDMSEHLEIEKISAYHLQESSGKGKLRPIDMRLAEAGVIGRTDLVYDCMREEVG